MQNKFVTTGPRRHKQYILMICVIRAVVSMRQDEAILACPQTPPAARAFGAPNLPRLVLKSGYGPGYLLCSALRYVTNT